MNYYDSGNSIDISVVSGTKLTANSWNHCVVSRSSNDWQMFVNGIVGETITNSTGTSTTDVVSSEPNAGSIL